MDRAKTVFYRALQQCPGEKVSIPRNIKHKGPSHMYHWTETRCNEVDKNIVS